MKKQEPLKINSTASLQVSAGTAWEKHILDNMIYIYNGATGTGGLMGIDYHKKNCACKECIDETMRKLNL